MGRGLRGVQLVISDAHAGLKRAIAEVLAGATWPAMSRALHAQCAGPRPEVRPDHGPGPDPADLRPAGSARSAVAAGVRWPASWRGGSLRWRREQHDEWLASRRYFSAESMAKLQPPSEPGETVRYQAPAEARE